MKKTLSFILSLVMVLSCAVTLLTNVSAETVAEAPAGIMHQHTEVANDTQDIRFIAGVKNLKGSCLGYKIVAEYTYESEYKRTLYEDSTSVVFDSIVADGETLTPTSDKLYGAETEYQYLFTMKITGVPANIGAIYFRIWTYVQVGEEKIWSEETNVQYIDGAKDNSLISYNFENVNELSDLNWETAIVANWGTSSKKPPQAPEIQSSDEGNKQLFLQGGGTCYQIVPESELKDKGITKYTIEMDVNVEVAGKFGLIFNNVNADTDSDTAEDFGDKIDFSIRGCNTTSMKLINVESAACDGTDKIIFRIKSSASTDHYIWPDGTGKYYTHPFYKFGNDLHLKIVVDNTNKTLTFCVNGKQIYTITPGYTTTGGVYMSNQNAPMTIDNIRVYGE